MGLFNFKAAGKVLKDARQDVKRPKDEVAAKRQEKTQPKGGKK